MLVANILFIAFFFYVYLGPFNWVVRSELQYVIRALCRYAGVALLLVSPSFFSVSRRYTFVGLAVATLSFAIGFLMPTMAYN